MPSHLVVILNRGLWEATRHHQAAVQPDVDCDVYRNRSFNFVLQIVRAGNSYPGASGSPWYRPFTLQPFPPSLATVTGIGEKKKNKTRIQMRWSSDESTDASTQTETKSSKGCPSMEGLEEILTRMNDELASGSIRSSSTFQR